MSTGKTRKGPLTTWAIVLVAGLLLLVNTVLGGVLVSRSRQGMLQMIYDRMLDISRVAAAKLDGDMLAGLTAADSETPAYQEVLKKLAVYQENINLDYIYIIRPMPDGTFTFGPDPTEEDPGMFGGPIVSTPALVRAAEEKVSTVDEEPYEDEWGRFYSAYTPVLTSAGEVGGIVGVDFSADWLEKKVNESVRIVIIGCAVSTLLAVLLVLALSAKLSKRLKEVHRETAMLSESVSDLSRELSMHTVVTDEEKEQAAADDKDLDEIGLLTRNLQLLRGRMKNYIARMQAQATQDRMTGVNNRSLYASVVKRLDAGIRLGSGVFTLVIFDVDCLKEANDSAGHDVGDNMLVDAANLIAKAFGRDCVYRIGGDEFIAVLEGSREADANMRMRNFTRLLSDFNKGPRAYDSELSVSMGMAVYHPQEDAEYRDVFRRADEAMYAEKDRHHKAGK